MASDFRRPMSRPFCAFAPTRIEAEKVAFENTVTAFLDATHPDTDPSRCAHCGRPRRLTPSLLPIGVGRTTHGCTRIAGLRGANSVEARRSLRWPRRESPRQFPFSKEVDFARSKLWSTSTAAIIPASTSIPPKRRCWPP